jgi:Flp pilus assembly protein TadB
VARALLLYCALLQLGFAPTDSKGLSLLGLFVILAIGFFIYRWWLKSRRDRRFDGLSLEEQMVQLEKWLDEQVATRVVTRAELEAMRERARNTFERRQ